MSHTDTDYSLILDILEDILGEPRLHNDYKGQISFDCPVCSYEIKGLDEGDGKGNLEVNYIYNVYKCWACGETNSTHGSLFWLIKKYGTKKHLTNYLLVRPEETPEFKQKFIQVKLPKEFVSLKEVSAGLKLTHHFRQATNYLKSRNVTDEMISRYNIGFAYDGPYSNRIIIPSYDSENELNYFIARSYLSKTKLKYKNPEARKEIIIFNEHLIDWDKPIYLVEGAFDSIFVPNSIPLLGKVLSEHLLMKLYYNAKKVIVLLDGDAWDNAQRIYETLNGGNLMGKIWLIKLPEDKDIADLQGNLKDFEEIQLY